MSTQPLPLSILCNVSVQVTPQGVAIPSFNQGIIIGNSNRIPSVGTNSRARQYAVASFPQNIVADGYQPTDPEYIAAGLLCSQTPPPQFFWLGAQDPTAIAATGATIGAAAGTGYTVGDIVTVVHAGAQLGKVKILTAPSGVPATVQVVEGSQGTGYVVSTNNATTGGTGTGLTINITAIGETPLEAVTACRLAQPAWYTAEVVNAVKADHVAIAAFAQSATPPMQYLGTTADADVPAGTAGNVLSVIKAGAFSRTHLTYATTQGGSFPNQAYFSAAVMGTAMGLNTGLANSNFTLANKVMVGVFPEPLSLTQIGVIAGIPGTNLGNNGNVYVNFANDYNLYQQGVNGNGSFFDQILGLDMLAADLQLSIVTQLATLPPAQTDAGQAQLLTIATAACKRSAARGFISGGTWTGPTVLNLTAGTSLPNGYSVQSPLVSSQSTADRRLRKALPIYVSIIEAGSMQSATIGVFVQI